MKKQKNYYKKLWIILISMLGLGITIVYAQTGKVKELSNSISNLTGSHDSQVEFTVVGTEGTNFATSYANEVDNSSIIGNFFKGYYYDSAHGYFKLDWNSTDKTQNVRIVNSTDKCNGYGYKLSGYAYNDVFGFIDFSYNDEYFVYYCVNDKKLHGYAYLDNIGFQSFENIGFEIAPEVISESEIQETDKFLNDTREITNPYYENEDDVINGNIQYIKDTDGSIFYIIK